MSQEKEKLFYSYSQKRERWVLSHSESPGVFNALVGVQREVLNGTEYWFLTRENLSRNLGFLRAVGYRLHDRSPLDESGNEREVPAETVKTASASFVVKPSLAVNLAGTQENPYHISQIAARLGEAVDSVYGKSYLWVEGEISGFKRNQSGTCFFDLLETENGEAKHKIRAQIWSRDWREICETFSSYDRPNPKEGDKVSVQCEVNFYRPQSTISLQVHQFDLHFGEGEFLRKKREITDRLKAEGLFYLNKSLPDPELPFRIAVFSNPTAAGYTDFLTGLKETGYPFSLTMFEIALQGKNVESSFMGAMSKLRAIGESSFDYGVILRGGGAVTDLAWFNNYEIAKVVSGSKLKFIAGIGHQKDSTVLDDMLISAMTPTAARDYLCERAKYAEDHLNELESELINDSRITLQTLKERLKDLSGEVTKRAILAFHNEEKSILRYQSDLAHAVNTAMKSHENKLLRLKDTLRTRAQSANEVAKLNLKIVQTNLSSAVREKLSVEANELSKLSNEMRYVVKTRIQQEEGHLQLLASNISNEAQTKQRMCQQELNERAEALKQITMKRLEQKQNELNLFEKVIKAQDPREIMKRGFICLSGSDGKPVTSIEGLHKEDTLKATLIDGLLDLSIINIRKDHNG